MPWFYTTLVPYSIDCYEAHFKKEEQSEEINAEANKNNPVVKKIVTEKHTEAKSKSIIRGNRRVINTDDGQKNIF